MYNMDHPIHNIFQLLFSGGRPVLLVSTAAMFAKIFKILNVSFHQTLWLQLSESETKIY